MNYQQAVKFLYDLRLSGLKFGLETTRQLAARAGQPQERLRFIHVAGTNGKGSTCALLESIYRAAGLRVGLFTSPHLISFRERIQINRQLISEEEVARLTAEIAPLFDRGQPPTFFEAVTVMALKYFEAKRCELVIWETGLGGRLDATNIVTPLAAVITNAQLDHQKFLGDTIPEIAREKAGIIKAGIPVITAAQGPALAVVVRVAEELRAPLTVVDGADAKALESCAIGLPGAHQRLNAAVALAAVRAVGPVIPVSVAAARAALGGVNWPGRLQRVQRGNGQVVLLDGAHNPAGAETLAAALPGLAGGKAPAFILGTMADKDSAGICGILAPLASKLFVSPVGSERAADPRLLAEQCRQANPAATVTICRSLEEALERAAGEPFVVVTGSLHFIGEALEALGLAAMASERELNEYLAPAARAAGCRDKIQAVTFDIGGTLIEPWPSVGHVYAEVAERHGVKLAPEILNRQFAEAWRRKKNFRHSLSDWANLVDETFAGLMEEPPSGTFFPEIYARFARADAWRVFDDVKPVLEALRGRGVKLGAISNWDERLRPLLAALGLDHYFDTITVSVEADCPKPAGEIFRLAAEGLGAPPGAILHVGDSRVEDLEGARSAGLRALLLQRGAAEERPDQIRGLDEVLERVDTRTR